MLNEARLASALTVHPPPCLRPQSYSDSQLARLGFRTTTRYLQWTRKSCEASSRVYIVCFRCANWDHSKHYFAETWTSTVKRSKASLDEDDQETIDGFKTWDAVETWILNSAPSSIMVIRPALHQLNVLGIFIVANLAPFVDTPYLWGSLACLLQVSPRCKKNNAV